MFNNEVEAMSCIIVAAAAWKMKTMNFWIDEKKVLYKFSTIAIFKGCQNLFSEKKIMANVWLNLFGILFLIKNVVFLIFSTVIVLLNISIVVSKIVTSHLTLYKELKKSNS